MSSSTTQIRHAGKLFLPARIFFLFLTVLSAALPLGSQQPAPTSWVILGAQVADGTGARLRRANVRILGDRIIRVGRFRPAKNERVVQADGLALAPGFLDIHNHSTAGLEKDPLAETQISQGITTIVLGADGESPWPIGEFLDRYRQAPVALNLPCWWATPACGAR